MRPATAFLTRSAALLLAALAGAGAAAAQSGGSVREGDQVRSRSLAVQGVVRRVDDLVLVLRPDVRPADSLVIPLARLRDLEVNRGSQGHPLRGAAIGSAGFGLGVAAVAAVSWQPCTRFLCFSFGSSRGEAATNGFIYGAAIGAGLGAFIGALAKRPAWEPADVQVTGFLAPRESGRLAAGLQLRL